MTEANSLVEIIASDDYWHDSEPKMPPVHIKAGLNISIETASAHFNFIEGSIRRAKRLYSDAASGGYVSEEIPGGRSLSGVLDDDCLLRVVEDSRRVYLPGSSSRFENRGGKDTQESFDELAQKMIAEMLYSGRIASILIKDLEPYRTVRIMRGVSYLVRLNDDILSGADCDELYSLHHNTGFDGRHIPTSVIVGKGYSTKKDKTEAIKIVRADLVMPGSGSRGKAPKKSKFSLKPAYNI